MSKQMRIQKPDPNSRINEVILPPSTIGILGGGQLGRMMALEARNMGYRIVTLDPTEHSPCAQVADEQIVADFTSLNGAKLLAQKAQIITYEFENIGPEVADHLETISYLPQGYQLLHTTQNRLREKRAIKAAGIPVAPFHPVEQYDQLVEAVALLGYPAVLKTAEGGYDGKGQRILRSEEDLLAAKQWLVESKRQYILEQFIPYTKEISVLVARSVKGEKAVYPVAENIHVDHILHASIVPARVSRDVQQKAKDIALRLADHFQLVGLLAIELFLLEDDTLYVNELAPRPHNSGHYTQQGCHTSQFEQHIRAICNLPLGSTELICPTVMVNILGEHLQRVIETMPRLDPAMHVHLYGKKEAKEKRKMGHLNVRAHHVQQALDKLNALGIWQHPLC